MKNKHCKLLLSTRQTKNKELWLKTRQQGIGGTDASALIGVNPYKTPLEVYRDKLNLKEETTPPITNVMRRGIVLEEIVAREFTKRTGIKLSRGNKTLPVGILQSNTNPVMIGNIDRVVVGEKKLVEIKTVSSAKYYAIQKEGLPLNMWVQGQHYLAITGYNSIIFIIFCPDKWEFLGEKAGILIEKCDDFIQNLSKTIANFWSNHIITQIPPPFVSQTSFTEDIAKHLPKTNGNLTKIETDDWLTAAKELKRAQTAKKEALKQEKEAKNKLKEIMYALNTTKATGHLIKKANWYQSTTSKWDIDGMRLQLRTLGVSNIKKHYYKTKSIQKFLVSFINE